MQRRIGALCRLLGRSCYAKNRNGGPPIEFSRRLRVFRRWSCCFHIPLIITELLQIMMYISHFMTCNQQCRGTWHQVEACSCSEKKADLSLSKCRSVLSSFNKFLCLMRGFKHSPKSYLNDVNLYEALSGSVYLSI